MDISSILKMVSNGKSNPVLEQLLMVKSMLDKLPREEQIRVVGDFIKNLEEAVKKGETNNDMSKE